MQRLNLLLMLALALLAGCAGMPPTADPPPLTLALQAGTRLNPGADGRAAPVEIRLFQLADAGRFQHAGFLELYRNASATLGDKTPAPTVVFLRPGQAMTRSLPLAAGTRLLAVMVCFRDYPHSRWRASVVLDPAVPPQITIDVGNGRVTVTARPAARPGFWQRLLAR